MTNELQGQRVLNAGELQLVAVSNLINTLVGVTPKLLTRPSEKSALICDVESGNFRYRIGDISVVGNLDLVTNGGFATDTDWTKGVGWTIAGGVANSDATQITTSDLTQDITALEGRSYEVTFTVSNYVAGNVTPVVGDVKGTDRAANGTFVEVIVAGAGGDIDIRADLDFDGDIDNVSVIWDTDIVTNGTFTGDTDWTKGTGWTLPGTVASSDGTQGADADLTQTASVALITGEYYEITFTVSNYSAGNVTPIIGDSEGTDRAANGTFTEVIQADGTDQLIGLRADLDFIGDVDDIIVTVAALQSTIPAISQTDGVGSLKIRTDTPIAVAAGESVTVVGASASDILTYYWV